jgi:NDP-sugar pyrophosphorylase family protein
MKIVNHAFIMAAGRGVRLRPITNFMPKGMVLYKNQTLISQGINKLKKFVKNIHISVGYKGSMLAKHCLDNNISSILNTKAKSNSWWIFNSIFKTLNEPIFVLTCDNVTSIDFLSLEKDYIKKKKPPCMLVSVNPIEGLHGDFIHHKKNIVTALSRKNKSKVYCSGIQIINPYVINNLMKEKDDFKKIWKVLIKKKKLYVSDVKPKKWFTVDNIHNYEALLKI